MAVDLPPQEPARVMCSIAAAVRYQIPANIILAISDLEGGKPGQVVCKNRNRSCDVGPMQFNTNYLKELSRYGITARDVSGADCYPYTLAAWRVRGHLKNDSGDIWTRAANYHSKTAQFNRPYRARLILAARRWAKYLAGRFKTSEYAGISQ